MHESDLTLQALVTRLRLEQLPVVEPPENLWPRIAALRRQHAARSRARRRWIAAGCIGVIAFCASAGAWFTLRDTAADIDWQARAQALELELHALEAREGVVPESIAPEAFGELVSLDASLQAAYDGAADHKQVVALWKRRSELLKVLLQAREQKVEISRI